jgi:hypothetical protein
VGLDRVLACEGRSLLSLTEGSYSLLDSALLELGVVLDKWYSRSTKK